MGSEAKERTELEVSYEVFRSQLRRVKSLPDMGPLACTVAFFADEESAMEFCKWLGELRNCVSAADEAFPNLVDHIAAANQRAEAAEHERDEIKQRTTTAIDQFDKLAELIDAECKALGIEWRSTAETTLKAVLAKLREKLIAYKGEPLNAQQLFGKAMELRTILADVLCITGTSEIPDELYAKINNALGVDWLRVRDAIDVGESPAPELRRSSNADSEPRHAAGEAVTNTAHVSGSVTSDETARRDGPSDSWEIVEIDGKRYRKEPEARCPKLGEKYLSTRGKEVLLATFNSSCKHHILHEITDEAPAEKGGRIEWTLEYSSPRDNQNAMAECLKVPDEIAESWTLWDRSSDEIGAEFYMEHLAKECTAYLNGQFPEHARIRELEQELDSLKTAGTEEAQAAFDAFNWVFNECGTGDEQRACGPTLKDREQHCISYVKRMKQENERLKAEIAERDDVVSIPDVIRQIAAERARQVAGEGWSAEHDDEHIYGQLAMAAACYAAPQPIFVGEPMKLRDAWPWEKRWDKRAKHSPERRLVIAGALIVAELERMSRGHYEPHSYAASEVTEPKCNCGAKPGEPASSCADCSPAPAAESGKWHSEDTQILIRPGASMEEANAAADWLNRRTETESRLSALQQQAEATDKDHRAMEAVRKHRLDIVVTGDLSQFHADSYKPGAGIVSGEYTTDPADAVLALAQQLEADKEGE
jgi:hypothetical protein